MLNLILSYKLFLRLTQNQTILAVRVPDLDDVSVFGHGSIVVERIHSNFDLRATVSCLLPGHKKLSSDAHSLFGLELAHPMIVRLENIEHNAFEIGCVLGNSCS